MNYRHAEYVKKPQDIQQSFRLPLHKRTKSRTVLTYENDSAIGNKPSYVQKLSKDDIPKLGLDDLAFTKASTLEVQIVEDNAYLKSSIRYFQKQNQRLLKLIAQKDQRIVSVKDKLTNLLIRQNQTLTKQNKSLQKVLQSRSQSRLGSSHYRTSYNTQYVSEANKSVDSKNKYINNLKSMKSKLDRMNTDLAERIKQRSGSRFKNKY